MIKIYRTLLSLAAITLITFSVAAQEKLFSDLKENAISLKTGKRVIFPEKYRTGVLNIPAIKGLLNNLPADKNGTNQNTLPEIELPMPDGTSARFAIWESSIMEPGLQAKFPEIRTYAGQGIDDPSASLKMDYSPYFGFSAQVLSPRGNFYIDPYARGNADYYISYYSRDYQRQASFACETPEQQIAEIRRTNGTNSTVTAKCRGTQLYTYRLAIACTGEYAIAATGESAPSVAETLAKIVTTVNRVDGVYETELSIRLVLVANNSLVVFTDPATDPFTGNNSASTLINESQTVINNYIGTMSYDIGHTFSTGGGGLASVGSVCTGFKARGITGSPSPVGDVYDIDYVAHEMGHQFGANHIFNSTISSCAGSWISTSAYEVGSGTSIMGYAGICSTDNIQPHSDPFFHAKSFDEISLFLESGGAMCRVVTTTGNTLPVISAMSNNGAYIPRNTPFTLTAAATDANGDALTYSWEEWDLGPSTVWNGGATSTTAPLFKSRAPKTTGSRTFPDMAVILAGYPASPSGTMGGLKGETLPSVARAMKFRLTVRDNRAGGGGRVTGGSGCQLTTAYQINVVNTSGPFAVTIPNGGQSYTGGTLQTITWNVVGTNASPISCANVKITLSTDGGLTYPTVIIASTPNDGTQAVTIPAVITTTARIKIEAVGNIFFDISDADFSISAPLSCGDPTGLTVSALTMHTATLGWTTVPYANNYDVDYKASSDSAWINLANATNTTSVSVTGLDSLRSYDWRVRANCSFGTGNYVNAQFTTPGPCPGPYDISSNGLITGAALIPLNTGVNGMINPKGDIDYYKFVITTGGTVTLSLTTLPADFNLSLHNSAGTQLLISKNTGTANETINTTLAPGTYYAKVFGASSLIFNASSCYTLKIATGTASRSSEPVIETTMMSVYPNPVIKTATIILPQSDAIPEINVYDMYGRMVMQKPTGNKNKQFDFSALPAGVYMIKATSNGVQIGTAKIVKQ